MDWYYNFNWASAPLSHPAWPIGTITAYWVIITILKRRAEQRAKAGIPPDQGVWIPVLYIHNHILSIGSAAIVIGALYELYGRFQQSGTLSWMICEPEPASVSTGPLWFWSYVYYLSKYYELLDTILALARGSLLPSWTLHVWHHSCVMFMAWVCVSMLWAGCTRPPRCVSLLHDTHLCSAPHISRLGFTRSSLYNGVGCYSTALCM